MINAKLNEEKNAVVVKKISLSGTLRNIPHRTRVHFMRRDLETSEGAMSVAVSRLNRAAGRKEFTLKVDMDDGSFWITRD